MDTDLVTKTFSEKSIQIIGEKFQVDFAMAKAILHFQSENLMEFTITEREGKSYNEIETVAINLTEIRSNLYIVTWKEENKNTITQIQDFTNGIVYSNWTTPNGEFINIKGTILPIIEHKE